MAYLLANEVSPSVHLQTLLTGFAVGDWPADVTFAFLLLAASCYLWGVRSLRRRGRSWPWARTVAFLSGIVVLFVAVDSGVSAYDDSVFTVHVVQHLLIMMIAPPVLSLGAPVTLALQASPRPLQSRLARLLRNRGVHVVTSPMLASALYYLSMWVLTLTAFYPYTLQHPLVHDATHIVLLMLGCLFWWPLVAVDELPHRPSMALRMGLLFVGVPFEAFLGIVIMAMRTSIAPEHTLSDTHTGGGVFWAAAMVIMLGAAVTIAAQWMRQEDRHARQADRVAESSESPGEQRAGQAIDWAQAWLARTGTVPPRTAVSTPPGEAHPS